MTGSVAGILASSDRDEFVHIDVPLWAWGAVLLFIGALLVVDILVLHREAKVPTFKRALLETLGWISIGLGFGAVVWSAFGHAAAGEYYAGYLIELSLSIDNVFVWSLLLTYFAVPRQYQHRVLFWGVFGAITLRAIFVFAGVALVNKFEFVLVVFGVFLLYSAFKILRHDDAHEVNAETSRILRLVRRVVPSTDDYDGQKLFTHIDGVRLATPLFAVLVLIETTDVLFAVDSVPAVLAVSREQFIVLTSNAFAILGLRSLYFLFAGLKDRFVYLQQGLAVILAFVGMKMIVSQWLHISTAISLGVIVVVLAVAMAVSVLAAPIEGRQPLDSLRRMGIAADDIEKVRSALSIVDVIQPYVALRKVGGNWVGLCPFHAEKTGSFNVRDTTGRYKCFGCAAGGDVFTFVQEIEHVDFVTAVERLAGKAGVQLTYTTGGEGRERQQRGKLIEAMSTAVEWYHDRLLTAPDARMARDYLRSRGLSGEVARRHRLGWAPDDWDAFSRGSGLPADALQKTGLAFVNKRNRLQDAFRGRVLFPIFTADGDPVAFGGRVLPGSTDPAKYKNSPETAIYAKSKTLYGLNWAKADVVASNQVIVCEGYTDVIGFQRSGVPRAVATCGTALTEDHVRLLKRYASRVVLAFDADAAGQGAADRFYEWEQKYQVEVSVARFPDGRDPGDLASADPDALRQAVERAEPFLGFRVHRVLAGHPPTSPEARARLANQAMAVINEHPDDNVRRLYAGEVASHTGLSPADLVRIANQKGGRVAPREEPARRALAESAEFVALALLIQRWDDIAPWLVDPLFHDGLHLRAFRALAHGAGDLDAALTAADPEAREVIERAAVADVEQDPEAEVRNLINAAVRRELAGARSLEQAAEWGEVRRLVEQLDDPISGLDAADRLLQWLGRRSEERS